MWYHVRKNKPRDAGLRQGRVGMLVRVCKVGSATCRVWCLFFPKNFLEYYCGTLLL